MLVRLCEGRHDPDVARALARLAVSSYKKPPGIGPRPTGLGNACVAVLGTMPGVESIGLLAMLKTRVKVNSALKQIEKAFDTAAKREALDREAIEELVADVRLSAPLATYGVTTADLDPIVEDALADAVMANTPRPPHASDVRTILEAVL